MLDIPIRLLSGGPANPPGTDKGKAAEGLDSVEHEAAQPAAQEAQVLHDCHLHLSTLVRCIASLRAMMMDLSAKVLNCAVHNRPRRKEPHLHLE